MADLASEEIDLRDSPECEQELPSSQQVIEPGVIAAKVSDPQKQGSAKVIFYQIESKRQCENGSPRHYQVRRRFSDFSWLRDELLAKCPGSIVPTLPPRTVLGAMKPRFIEKRLRGLNIFLEGVIAHSNLKECSSLAVFLMSNDTEFTAVKAAGSASDTALSSATWLNFVNQKIQSVQGSILGPSSQSFKTNDDIRIDTIAESVSLSLKHANNCMRAYQPLSGFHKDAVQLWSDFGLSLTIFADTETQKGQSVSGGCLNQIGLSADRVSVLTSDRLDKESREFKEPLKDLIEIIHAVEDALRARSDASNAVQRAAEAYKSRKEKLDSMRGKSTDEKIAVLEEETSNLLKAETESEVQLAKITEEVFREFDRFQEGKQQTIKKLAQSFVRIQLHHAQKMCSSWQTAADNMENI